MKFILLIGSFFLISFSGAAAPLDNGAATVHLKNGSVIHASIVEWIPGKSIKIVTADNNIFVFSYEEVEKVISERGASAPTNTSGKGGKNPGLFDITSGGFASMIILNGPSISTVNGFQFSKYFSLGLGLEADLFPYPYSSSYLGGPLLAFIYTPITVDLRFYIPMKDAAPFVFFDAGIALPFTLGFTGIFIPTPTLGGGFGVSLFSGQNAGVVFELGFRTLSASILGGSSSVGLFTLRIGFSI